MSAFLEFHGHHIELPDPARLRMLVITYLHEGNEHEEAELVGRCALEVGFVKGVLDNKYAIDVTLRCCRDVVNRLRSAEAVGEDPVARRRIRQAIRDALPGSFCLAAFEARAGLPGGPSVVPGPPPTANGQGAPAGSIQLGRLRYLPGFARVWLGAVEYDLRERKKIRLCLKYLVEKKAFTPASARHFLDEINPYVMMAGDYPKPAAPKIDHYFNDRSGRLRTLRKELIHAEGGTGRYYLKTD